MSMTPEKHVERAEKLLEVAEGSTGEYQIGFALRAMAHMQLARLLHDDPYLVTRAKVSTDGNTDRRE